MMRGEAPVLGSGRFLVCVSEDRPCALPTACAADHAVMVGYQQKLALPRAGLHRPAACLRATSGGHRIAISSLVEKQPLVTVPPAAGVSRTRAVFGLAAFTKHGDAFGYPPLEAFTDFVVAQIWTTPREDQRKFSRC